MAKITSRGGYDKPFLSDNWFLNNLCFSTGVLSEITIFDMANSVRGNNNTPSICDHQVGAAAIALPEGGTHILRHAMMCRSNGSLFHKKSLKMGLIFYKNIPKYGSVFKKFHMKIVKNGPIFGEKSLKMGAFFCQNYH